MTFDRGLQSRRAWARIAGAAYLIVMVVDLTGLQIPRQLLGKSLLLTGSLLVVPLALGLYFTLRIFQPVTSAIALVCRLVETFVGMIAALARFETVRSAFADTYVGNAALDLVAWNAAKGFDALMFTIGSTLFFFVFVRSGAIPKVLAWLGLAASVIAFAACATHVVQPSFPMLSAIPWIPMLFAEFSTGSWLLLRAVRDAPVDVKVQSVSR